MIHAIAPVGAPPAIGPYSPAIRAGGTVYFSGQLPVDPETGELPDGIAAQTRQGLRNVARLVAAAGLTMANVVSVTVLLADIADFDAMNAVYAEFFTAPYPARVAYQVAALPKGALIEIAATGADA